MKKTLLLTLSLLILSQNSMAAGQCVDLFKVVKTPVSKTPKKVVLVDGKKEGAAQKSAAKLEADVKAVKEVFQMTDAEIDGLVSIYRKEMKDNTLTREEILQKLYEEKRNFDASIDGQLRWFGFSLSKAVRDMRKRRQLFDVALIQGDGLIAANLYRSLYESYGISMSLLVNYARGDVKTRDAEMMSSVTPSLLRGLTADSQFKDIRKKVEEMYKADRTPDVSEVLNILDLVVSRTNDEFRYIEFRLNQIEKSPDTKTSTLDNVKYVRNRLSIDPVAQKFRLKLLSDVELRAGSAASAIFNSRPQILVYWLKRVAQLQRRHSFMLRVRSVLHIESFQKILTRLPVAIRGAVLSLVRIDYNTYVIDRHIESIEAVLLAEKDVQLQVFQEKVGMGDKHKSEQFLETMARLSSSMETWNSLKEQVSDKADKSANYKELLAQMEKAEKTISKLGFISKLESPSMHDHLVGWILPGSVGLGTLAYQKWDVLQQGYQYLLVLTGLN